MAQPTPNDAALKWLLRIIGGVELCALPFVLFPFALMHEVHDRALGLGALPHAPIVEYLARSLSALYAVHGAVVFFLSFDVSRYRPLIGFLGGLHIAFGLTVLSIDLGAGLPLWWVAGEGPGIAVGGVLVLILARRRGGDVPDPPT